MISEKNKSVIQALANRYKVKRVLLFGSNASVSVEGRDIDLAVEGIAAKDFFKSYGDLIFDLDKPVDLVDLSVDTKFNRLIRQEGIPLYG